MGNKDVYNGKGKKLVLASLSNLYSKLEVIPISASRFFYLTLYYLLTI